MLKSKKSDRWRKKCDQSTPALKLGNIVFKVVEPLFLSVVPFISSFQCGSPGDFLVKHVIVADDRRSTVDFAASSHLALVPRTADIWHSFNPIPTRGGGGGAHCAPPPPPPRYTSSNISGTPWATDLKLSDRLNEFNWKKKLFFNRLRPPLVTIATFKVDACFWKAHFGSFHAKAYQNSMFFATPMKNGRTVVCCENLG